MPIYREIHEATMPAMSRAIVNGSLPTYWDAVATAAEKVENGHFQFTGATVYVALQVNGAINSTKVA